MEQSSLLAFLADSNTVELGVLGALQPGDKLRVTTKCLEIDPPAYARKVRRFFSKENRTLAASAVERIVGTSRRLVRRLTSSNELEALEHLKTAMRAAIVGIENLKQTYVGDASVQARLTVAACKLGDALQSCVAGLGSGSDPRVAAP